MPYLFPYENLFIAGTSLLIVALLMMRCRLARNSRRQPAASGSPADSDHAVQSNRTTQANQADKANRADRAQE